MCKCNTRFLVKWNNIFNYVEQKSGGFEGSKTELDNIYVDLKLYWWTKNFCYKKIFMTKNI